MRRIVAEDFDWTNPEHILVLVANNEIHSNTTRIGFGARCRRGVMITYQDPDNLAPLLMYECRTVEGSVGFSN